YGTVTSMQIEEKIAALGYTVDRKNIVIKDHIKSGGKYKFSVHLYNDIYADMELEVIPVAQKEEKPERPQRRRRRYEDYYNNAPAAAAEEAQPAETAEAPAATDAE
ncbi:MAG: hypothetical protein J6W76_07285, partial [Spirochaetales bacterium]|nr:hypothetical protein [Spirochaetales bacterium]